MKVHLLLNPIYDAPLLERPSLERSYRYSLDIFLNNLMGDQPVALFGTFCYTFKGALFVIYLLTTSVVDCMVFK